MKYKLGQFVLVKNEGDYFHSNVVNQRTCHFDEELLIMMGAIPIDEKIDASQVEDKTQLDEHKCFNDDDNIRFIGHLHSINPNPFPLKKSDNEVEKIEKIEVMNWDSSLMEITTKINEIIERINDNA